MGQVIEAITAMCGTSHEIGYLATTPVIRGAVRTAEGLAETLRALVAQEQARIERYKRQATV